MNWIKKNWIWLLVNLVALLPTISVLSLFNVDFLNGALQVTIDLPGRFDEEGRRLLAEKSELWLPIHITGEWAIRWLTVSLTITPLTILFGFKNLRKYRKLFGLYAFAYSLVHLLFFIADKNLIAIFDEINFILGMVSFLIMLPLAITSNKRSIRALKKAWKSLHKWAYAAGILSVFHVALLEQGSWVLYAIIIAIGFVIRLDPVKRAISNFRLKLEAKHSVQNA